MVDEKHIDIAQLNEASEYREKCEKQEHKIKKLRNTIASLFLFSLVVMATSLLLSGIGVFDGGSGSLSVFMSILGYFSLLLGVAFLIWLIIVFVRFTETQSLTEEARKMEGTIAQHLFKLTLSGTNS